MEFFERKSVKLLTHAGKLTQDMIGESLCDQPDPRLMRRMLKDMRDLLDEFEESYFLDDDPLSGSKS